MRRYGFVMRRGAIRAALLVAGLSATRVAAQDTARVAHDTSSVRRDTTKTTTLAGVVVTATRAATSLGRVTLHTTVIGQQDIQRAPARTLDQVLRNVAGMNMSGVPYYATDPTGQQTKMRGVSNSKVLVMVDGVPIHDPFYSTTQWFKVPLSSIDRVEVVRGANSSLWGSLAVAGVVNIITKKPIDNDGQIDLSYGSLNTSNVAASKNWVFPSGFAVRVSGDLLNTDGYQTTPSAFLGSVPGKAASSATNGNVQAAAYYQSAGDFEAFLRAGYHRANEDIGGYRYGTNLQKSPDAAGGFTTQLGTRTRADVRVWTQFVGFDKYNGAGCYLASSSTCNTSATDAPLVQYVNSHDANPYHELGGSALLSTETASRWAASLQTGVDYRLVGGDDDATTYNKPTAPDAASSTINRTNAGSGTQQFVGLFAQLLATPVRPLHVTLSMRYDYWANTGAAASMTKYSDDEPTSTTGGPVADSHRGSFNPSLSLRYDMGDHVAVRGAIYRSFRAPGLNNLYRSYSSTTFITIANPNLSPETLTGGELGADLHAGAVTAGITGFQYDTKDLIASYKIASVAAAPPQVIEICGPELEDCPATVNFNTNGQNAVSRGLELTGAWAVNPVLSLDGSYTFTSSYYTSTSTGDPTRVQLGAIPKHVIVAGANWTIVPRWTAYASVRHSSAMFLDVNQTIPQEAYTLLDLSMGYRVNGRVALYGTASNLTDVTYSDNATTSAASATVGLGRTFTGGVRLGF